MSDEKVLGTGVVEILKAGLSGLVFLLAYMSYRLVRRLDSQSASPKSLEIAQRFMIFSLVLAVLVAVSSTIDLYMRRQAANAERELAPCRDAVARIKAAGLDPLASAGELRATMTNQIQPCELYLQQKDQERNEATR